MRIGLIDADLMDNGTRHPNLALMKIAGFYLDHQDEVKLIFDDYKSVYEFDKVFISKVFSFTSVPGWVMTLQHVSIGGTGFYEDGGENLPEEIEHHKPHYDLYKEYVDCQLKEGKNRGRFADYLDYSIGFTSRGCFRKCDFCVNKKYNHAFLHSPVQEFYDSSRPYIYLWDDNILALPQWEQIIDSLEETGRPFQFRQGIDIRLMTDQKARRFVNTNYQGDFIFAFDHLEDRLQIVEKVQLWKRYSNKVCKMYVLCAYKSQDEKDIVDTFERIQTLMNYGSIPYLMRYELYKKSPIKSLYIELARWCNQPNFFKKKSFREFCVANQEYKKNQETNCSAYQAMLDFESVFPDIAKKYFDLKFEHENFYTRQYGYGRKYANKPLCKSCMQTNICWTSVLNGTVSDDDLLRAYYSKEIDIECLRYQNAECAVNPEDISAIITQVILRTPISHIIQIIKDSDKREDITKENIPQYSSPEDAYYEVPTILNNSGIVHTFDSIGYYLKRNDSTYKQNPTANKKYGENHSKLAALLDLVCIDKLSSKSEVRLSELGKFYCKMPKKEQEILVQKLCLRIPIIQNFFIYGEIEDIIDNDLLILSEQTRKRRRSNVINMVRLIMK